MATRKKKNILQYIAYPKAMKLLTDRLDATPDEMAAWIYMGPEHGGIAAYSYAKEPDPQRFYYDEGIGRRDNFDYLSPLMACWFREDDIAHFKPAERFITGKALIERWGEQPHIQPEKFIQAKISELRLLDIHPIFGGTQGTFTQDATYPPLTSGLFELSHVEEIEAKDFAKKDEQNEYSTGPCKSVNATDIRHHFRVKSNEDENEEWWRRLMRDAKRCGLAECRVGGGKKGPGGSLWRPDLVATWLVDRQTKGRKGMSSGAARAALKKFPGCEELDDELFQPDK